MDDSHGIQIKSAGSEVGRKGSLIHVPVESWLPRPVFTSPTTSVSLTWVMRWRLSCGPGVSSASQTACRSPRDACQRDCAGRLIQGAKGHGLGGGLGRANGGEAGEIHPVAADFHECQFGKICVPEVANPFSKTAKSGPSPSVIARGQTSG